MKAIMRDKAELKDSGIEWIGLLPANWSYCKIKNMTTEPETIFTDGDWINGPDVAEEGIRYLTTGNIGQGNFKEQGNGFVTEKTFEELNCTAVYPGDLVISRLNSPVGRACIIPNTYPKYVVAVDNVILRPDLKYLRKFLMYCMSSDRYSEFTQLLARGTTMQRISRTQLGNIFLPVTTVDEQQVIVTYLDDRCSKIDAIIAEAKASIEEYKELKQAVIYEAVTKGLDKNVEMKDSGVEWIGEIPESWDIKKIKYVADFNPKITVEYDTDKPIGYVPMDAVKFGYMEPLEHDIDTLSTGLTPFQEKDIIMAKVTPCFENGEIAIAENLAQGIGFGSSELFVYRAKSINRRYLFYYLQQIGFKGRAAATMTGVGGLKRISSYFANNAEVTYPSLDEQRVIVDYLDKYCEGIKSLIFEKQSLIEDLESYKKSLIYEVVTGKRKVVE